MERVRQLSATARRSLGKRASQRSGASGEAVVSVYRNVARAGRTADVRTIATPTVGANGARRFRARSTVDGVGFMLDGTGRHVAEEIKTCASKRRLSLREVELHQRTYLDGVLAAGGVAVLTVVYGPTRDVFVIPWIEARGMDSLGTRELAPYRVTAPTYLRRFMSIGAPR